MSRALIDAAVVAAARGWIGTPYRHQASLRGVGCDCLGLLRGVWREVVGPEPETPPPYAPDWAEAGGTEALWDAAARWFEPADAAVTAGRVLLFRWREGSPAKHCAIATSPAAMIHAHEGAAVAEAPLPPFWRRRIVAVFRFPQGARP